MTFLLDAGVWIASASPHEQYHDVADSLVEADDPLAALDLTLFEVANVLGARGGDQRRAQRMCEVILTRCYGDRLIRVGPDLIEHALSIVQDHSLTAYDAAYVAAAKRNGWTLVSTDIADLVSKGLAVAPDAAA